MNADTDPYSLSTFWRVYTQVPSNENVGSKASREARGHQRHEQPDPVSTKKESLK